MTSLQRYYRIVALLAVIALVGCATGPSREVVRTRAANRVVDAYQIPDLLGQAAPAVTISLDKNLPDDVEPARHQRLNKIVTRVYEPQRLRGETVRRLKTNAVAEQKEQALSAADKALHTPLAQRMIALQSKVTNPDFAQGFNRFVKKPATDRRERRIGIVRSLASDMQVVQLQTDFNVALLGAMIRARNTVVGADQRATNGQIERILHKARRGIRGKLDKQVPLMLLYVYRDVDTPTLQRYAAVQATPEMVWANKALDQAVTDTLESAGDAIPKQFNANKE